MIISPEDEICRVRMALFERWEGEMTWKDEMG